MLTKFEKIATVIVLAIFNAQKEHCKTTSDVLYLRHVVNECILMTEVKDETASAK